MTQASALRRDAGLLAGDLPPLLAHAERLAATVLPGDHGRRRAGQGDEFWQYRPAHEGDEARHIDWRRSARSDAHFIRQKEWQAAQTVLFWVDDSRAMDFASGRDLPSKGWRARLLALACASLLLRGGERVGLLGGRLLPGAGERQLGPLVLALAREGGTNGASANGAGEKGAPARSVPGGRTSEYGVPALGGLRANTRAVMISDFLGDPAALERALSQAVDHGVEGVLLQVLDPQEEAFPFDGRTIFESMGGTLRHETLKAGELRARYLDRLAARKAVLGDLARGAGWQYYCHHTDQPASAALLWLYGALERKR